MNYIKKLILKIPFIKNEIKSIEKKYQDKIDHNDRTIHIRDVDVRTLEDEIRLAKSILINRINQPSELIDSLYVLLNSYIDQVEKEKSCLQKLNSKKPKKKAKKAK